MLTTLLLNANRVVPLDSLIDAVWTNAAPPTARQQVHTTVSTLRRLIGKLLARPDIIRTASPGYVMHTDPHWVDLLLAEHLVSEAATRQSPDSAARLLRQALSLWQGSALSGLRGATIEAEATRIEEWRLLLVEDMAAAELELDRPAAVIVELSSLAPLHPLRERMQALLIRALHRTGRTAEALDTYRRLRAVFRRELGVEPGPVLQQAQREVLHDGLPAKNTACQEPVRPAQLPPDITDFVGRGENVVTLRDTLRENARRDVPALLAIVGPGGVGKTALAVHVAHLVRDLFPDGHLYLDLRSPDGDPVPPTVALARLLHALGAWEQRVPRDLADRQNLYRSRLSDRRVLILLENAVDARQVQPLLPGAGRCAVLIASRSRLLRLDSVRRLTLDVLPPRQALELLRISGGGTRVDAEPGAARELAALCDHLPLALRAVGARLNLRADLSLATQLTRLADEGRRLDELTVDDLDVRNSIAGSYRSLDPHARKLFRRLGLLGASTITPALAATLLGAGEGVAGALLDRLASQHLLGIADARGGEDRYQFRELVRLYAQERAAVEETPEERRRVADLVLSSPATHDVPELIGTQ